MKPQNDLSVRGWQFENKSLRQKGKDDDNNLLPKTNQLMDNNRIWGILDFSWLFSYQCDDQICE